MERGRVEPVDGATPVFPEELPMFSLLVRLGLLAGFVAFARRVLAPETPQPRLAPPRGAKPAATTKPRTRERA